MIVSDFVLRAVVAEGVDTVFMVPGGVDDPFMGPMTWIPGLRTVVAAHEGGAAYMADGYARASGRFGVAVGIGGPGLFNMVTALASARDDHIRVLALSGEIPTDVEGRESFQDASGAGLDDNDVVRPVVGRTLSCERPETVAPHLHDVITHMLVRNEPAHLSIPVDVQQQAVPDTWEPLPPTLYRPTSVDAETLAADVWPTLGANDRVVVLAGAGVRGEDGAAALVAFAERFGVPVATTLAAKGVMPEDHPLSLGVFGYAGSRWATEALLDDEVDVLLVVGADLTQRNTMYWDERLRPRHLLVHVHDDATLIGRIWPSVPVVGDAAATLRSLLAADHDHARALEAAAPARRARVEAAKAAADRCYEPEHRHADGIPIHPARLVADLRAAAPRDTILSVDSGAHRAWAGHYWESYGPNAYLTGANLGPMGAALGLSIGAAMARPDASHACLIGDGCMLMHGMELHTAVRHEVPVVVVVVNNGAYGNIWFRARDISPAAESLTAIDGIDWAGFARSLGAEGRTVDDPADLRPVLSSAFATADRARRPVLVDVRVDKAAAKPIEPWTTAAHAWEDHH
jgi:acetolactate synthase-1/2/3 large subunit